MGIQLPPAPIPGGHRLVRDPRPGKPLWARRPRPPPGRAPARRPSGFPGWARLADSRQRSRRYPPPAWPRLMTAGGRHCMTGPFPLGSDRGVDHYHGPGRARATRTTRRQEQSCRGRAVRRSFSASNQALQGMLIPSGNNIAENALRAGTAGSLHGVRRPHETSVRALAGACPERHFADPAGSLSEDG